MANKDFTISILVNKSQAETFNAITNVQAWWSEEIIGGTAMLNDELEYHYKDDHRCKMRLIEVIPDQKVVWLVLDNYFKFTQDKQEWIGNTISFEISRPGLQTQIKFSQEGLVPAYECYAVCSNAWTHYLQGSLAELINTGKGKPNLKAL